jgi:hypothetical protein
MEITIVTSEPQAVDPDEIADAIINLGEEGRFAVASVRVIDREGIQADRVWTDGNEEPEHGTYFEPDPTPESNMLRPRCSCGWSVAGYMRPVTAELFTNKHREYVAKNGWRKVQ